MRMTTAAVVGLAVMVFVAAGALAAPEAKGLLDGKTFTGETGEKGKKGEKDTLHFADGRFRSSACDAYGFADAAYTASAAGSSITWTAETSSAKEGKISWKGTVKGDKLDGSYVWTKSGQAPIEYWIKATAQK